VAGVSWGAHLSCLILQYRGLIGSVLGLFYEYGKHTHAEFGKVQYRALRIALVLLGSTPNNCLSALTGIPPLAERFAYLNFRYLVAAFFEGESWSAAGAEHGSLHQRIFRGFIIGYSSVRVLYAT
jgi:hypothetical protein